MTMFFTIVGVCTVSIAFVEAVVWLDTPHEQRRKQE